MRSRALPLLVALAVCACAACAEEDQLIYNVFEPAEPIEEVPCPGTELGGPWKPREVPTTEGIAGIWASSPNNLWIAGGANTTFHFDGTNWTDYSPGFGVDFLAIHGSAADDVWAIGRAGVAVRWDGRRWTLVPTGTDKDILALWVFGPEDAWFAGEDGVRHWDGFAIMQRDDWPKDQVNAIWAASPREMRLVGNAEIHHYDGTRFTTQPIEKSGKLAAVWGTDATHVYAIGHNSMMRPGFAELVEGQWLFSGAPPRAFYFSLWTLEAGELWAGANDTTIFYYSDGKWCREHLGGLGAVNSFFGFSHNFVWAVGAVRDASGVTQPLFLERGGR